MTPTRLFRIAAATFSRRVPASWLTALVLGAALLGGAGAARAAEGIEIVQAHLEQAEDGYRLSATYAFELNRGLEDALARGLPLYFTTDVEVGRKRWYWFDEHAISASQTIRISYNVLTRQYHAAIPGQIQQSFNTLEDALLLVRRPTRWLIAGADALKRGKTYTVAVHMALDVGQLPKPFQMHALNSADWHLSSDWKTFEFTPE
ncbi:MAG: DUF4390 domain-containing protein [Burkholderiaceae bacterium]